MGQKIKIIVAECTINVDIYMKQLENELNKDNPTFADLFNYLIKYKSNNKLKKRHQNEFNFYYIDRNNKSIFLQKELPVKAFLEHETIFIEFQKRPLSSPTPTRTSTPTRTPTYTSTPIRTPTRTRTIQQTPPEPRDDSFNQFKSKIIPPFIMVFCLLGLLFPETLGSYMVIVGAISIPIIIRKTSNTIHAPALCFIIIAFINYLLTAISPVSAGVFGGMLFSVFFGYYFSRTLFDYQINIEKPLWFIGVLLLLIIIIVIIPFESNNKNIQGTSTPTSLVSPIIHSEGELIISQTWSADLDEGVVGGSMSDMDFWFVAETATERYLSPSNGAKMAIVGTTSVGINGCKTARLLQNRIDINDLSEGTYVCVFTNQGRYSEFRVDEPINPSPGTLIITYTTWGTTTDQQSSATKNVEHDVSKPSKQSLILTPSIKRLNVVTDGFNHEVTAAATAGLEETSYRRAFENGYYYVIDVQGEKYVALNGKVDKLARLILEQGKILKNDGTLNYVENKTLRKDETWDVGDGWTLEVKQFDHEARKVWIYLNKDGIKKDDFIIAEGGVLTYSEDFLAGEKDVPLFVTYMPTIFRGSTTDIAVFKYTWAISPSVKIIQPGDKLEDLEIISVDVLNHRLEVTSSNGQKTFQTSPPIIPILGFNGIESYKGSDGNQYVRYKLTIENWNAFPTNFFEIAPDLPQRGLNSKASRILVYIHDAKDNRILYGFSGFTSTKHLESIWFAVSTGAKPPDAVYVKLIDRQTDKTYISNTLTLS